MSIADNLHSLHQQIAAACAGTGRDPSSVRLMAVSKTQPAESILEAYAAGQRLFGENRVQEVQAKHPQLALLPGLELHLIGPLQNNKTARAAELVHSVDTLDSLKTAERLNRSAEELRRTLSVLIEVKLSPEDAKHGVAPNALAPLLSGLQSLPHLEVRGLMTVPPWTEDPEGARPFFTELRRLRDQHAAAYPKLIELSMGMSHDFHVAIQEGATTVRIGTAVFGRRG